MSLDPRTATLREWAAIASMFVLAALVGFREFVTGKLSPLFGDIRYTHYPLIQAGARRDGRWPLWSDHIFNGYPIFADSQAAQYYPPTWFVRWWGDPDAFTAVIVLHVIIAGLGMVAWLRGHGFGLPAQLVGALCFAFSGAFLNFAVHLGLFCVLAWVPAWLAALHRVVRTPSFARVAIAGLVLAALIFAGGPQMLATTVLLTGFYGLGLLVQHRDEWRGRALLERSGSVLAAVVVGACVGAVALLPQLEFIPLSQRSLGLELELASEPHLAAHSLWRLLANPSLPRPAGGQEGDALELYVGTLSVVLAIVGIVTAFARDHRREHAAIAAVMAAFALVTITAALGQTLPVFGWLVKFVPGFGYFRAPSRLIGVTGIALAYACALGLELWLRGAVRRRLLVGVAAIVVLTPAAALVFVDAYGGEALGVVALVIVALGLALLGFGHERRVAAGWLIVALTVLDLVFLAAPRNPFMQRGRDEAPSADELAGGSLQALAYIAEREPDPLDSRVIILEGFGYGSYNHPILRGLDGVSGYNGSSLLRFLDVMHLIETGSFYPRTGLYRDETALKPRAVDSPAVDMLGAPYVISSRALISTRYEFLRSLYADHRTERVFLSRRAVPRAYLSTKTIVAPTLAAREAALREFDPARETIVEDPQLELDGPATIRPVAITRLRSERLVLECTTEQAAVLVITDANYPGWRASVDGVETPIATVNHLFRGVLLEPGAHTVELSFRPRSFEIGWRLTLGMLALLAFGWAWSLRRRRLSDR